MPILKSLRSLDWPTLFAELLLVFVGITAALWFDNWNADRHERQLESQILAEIARALEADTTDLRFNLRSMERTRASIDTILAHFDQGLPYHVGLDRSFGRATRFNVFVHNTAAYEQLKAAGLHLISDADLRRDIIQYYETEAQALHIIESVMVIGHFDRVLQPQMIEKFSYSGYLEAAVPHDYELLSGDHEYRSALQTHLSYVRFKDSASESVLEMATELLSRIRSMRRPG